jgi:hypothetical protein
VQASTRTHGHLTLLHSKEALTGANGGDYDTVSHDVKQGSPAAVLPRDTDQTLAHTPPHICKQTERTYASWPTKLHKCIPWSHSAAHAAYTAVL